MNGTDNTGEPEHGQNGGSASASLARLSERSYSHAATLGSHGDRIDALEAYIVEQQSGSFWRWFPSLAIFIGGIFTFFVFGIGPLKDKDIEQDAALKETERRVTETLRREVELQHEAIDAEIDLVEQAGDNTLTRLEAVIRFLERQSDRGRVNADKP